MTTSQHRPREPRLARGPWLWRALRCAARAIRDIHNEQVYLWERLYLTNRALVPQAGPLAWIPTLDGYRLADLASQPAGSRPRVSYPASSATAPGHEPQRRRCDMDARTRLVLTQPTGSEARCEALFASALQPSDTPTADVIARQSASPGSGSARGAAPRRWRKSSVITPMRRPSGCAGRASSRPSAGPGPKRLDQHAKEERHERDMRSVRTRGPRGLPRSPRRPAVPVPALHRSSQPRAQGARLDHLASRTRFAQRTSRSVAAAAD